MTSYFGDGQVEEVFIKDLSVLKPEYQPDQIEEREEEIDEYVELLEPVLRGWDADNIFLFGESGVGKTLATRILLPELREKALNNGVEADIVETNCAGCNSSYQATIELINEMYNPSSPLTTLNLQQQEMANTGYPTNMVNKKLFEALQEAGEYIILVLDEIDGIGTDGDLLYQLTRSETMGKLDAELCIIGISNDLYFKDNMKTNVRDTLCESEIHFPEYDPDELRSILTRRAKKAFHEGVLADDVIPLCAAYAKQEHGSARYAIRLLRKAARLAEREARENSSVEQVTEEHVDAARDIIEEKTIASGIKKLSSQQCYILLSIAELHARNKTPAETSEIYSRYESMVERDGYNSISRRGAHNHLLSMDDKGIIEISNNARNRRGVPNKYSLVTDLETVINALEDNTEQDGDFDLQELRNLATRKGAL